MNTYFFHLLNSLAGQNAATDAVITFFAVTLPYLLIIGLGIFLFLHRDKPSHAVRDLFVVLTAAVCAYLIGSAIKEFFPTPRPFDILDIQPLFSPHGVHAFPSSHATFFMALAITLFFYHRHIAWFFFCAALVIGIARVAAGVHWPVDIFAGWIIGGGIGALSYLALQRLQKASKFIY